MAKGKKCEILVINQIAQVGLKRFPAERLQPLEHQAGDIDRVAGRRIEHRIGLGLRLVVHHARRALGHLADEIVAHDGDRQARGADVLLRTGVDQAELGDVERT